MGEREPTVEPEEGTALGEDAPAPTLAVVRARHPSSGRARTIPARKLSPSERARSKTAYYPEWADPRPAKRGDCGTARPCPYVSCSQHLYLDVDEETGSLKLNFPDIEVWQMTFSCALDEADATEGEGMTLEQVAERTNLTRERIRQLEERVRQQGRRSKYLRVILGDDD